MQLHDGGGEEGSLCTFKRSECNKTMMWRVIRKSKRDEKFYENITKNKITFTNAMS